MSAAENDEESRPESTGNPLAESLSSGPRQRESRAKSEATEQATEGGRTVRLNAEVPAGLYEDFRTVAEARERSISGEIRQIMREHVEQHRLRSRHS